VKKILIVEDNELNRMVLEEFLNLINPELDIVLSFNGKAGLAKIEETKFDVVFSDIDMPIMNGIEMIREIRKKYKDLKVIAVTAFAVLGDREKILLEGFDDYIPKPVDFAELDKIAYKYDLKG
jgi:CheY-like chemotaxis protein